MPVVQGGLTAIWGAGAVGGTIGAYLTRAGVNVLLIDRDAEHVEAMRHCGLTVEGPVEQFCVRVRAATPGEVSGTFHRILLCVEAPQTEAASRALLPHLEQQGVVASFQDGLNEPVIGEVVGHDRVAGARVDFGAEYIEPGRLLYAGRGACVLGELDGTRTPRLEALHRLVCQFEPEAEVTDDIQGHLWGRLGACAVVSATALTGEPVADALEAPEHRALLGELGREVMAVAAARGLRPREAGGFDPEAFAAGTAASSLDAMAAAYRRAGLTHCGVWRDLAVRKRPTEVEAQLGPVVAEAAALSVPVPLLGRLIGMIRDVEEGRREPGQGRLAELAG